MIRLLRKTFVGPTLYFGFKSLNVYRDAVRRVVIKFMKYEISPDCVVSVREHVTSNGQFSVTVWYRHDGEPISETMTLSNKSLKQIMKTAFPIEVNRPPA